jgi:DoxX
MSCIRLLLVELHASQWVGILLARLVVGSLFFLSGRGKLFLNERREQMRQSLREAHIPFPGLNAFLVSTVEFVFGLLLIAGAVTPVACVMLSGVMAGLFRPPQFEISKQRRRSTGLPIFFIFRRYFASSSWYGCFFRTPMVQCGSSNSVQHVALACPAPITAEHNCSLILF